MWGIFNLIESFVDNVFRDKVYPLMGSILYIDMAFGFADHSGVYVGNGQVVELSGEGVVQKVSVAEFMDTPAPVNTAMSVYVSSHNGVGVGSSAVAQRALDMVGSWRDYNLILDNCHQFCSGCITGNFENSDNFLWMLKDTARRCMRADEWRVWDR